MSTDAPIRAQYSRSSSSVQKVARPVKMVDAISTTIRMIGGPKQMNALGLFSNIVESGACSITM